MKLKKVGATKQQFRFSEYQSHTDHMAQGVYIYDSENRARVKRSEEYKIKLDTEFGITKAQGRIYF